MKREHLIDGELPSGYIKLKYLESTGTQYIDTGVVAINGFICVAGVMYTGFLGDYIIGSHNTSAPWGRNGVGLTKNGTIQLGCGDYYATSNKVSTYTFYEFEASTMLGDGYVDVNKTRKLQTSDSNIRSSNNILLFTSQYNLYVSSIGTSKHRLFYIQFTVDGVNHQYIPALRKSDNKPGLYDLCGSICPLTGTPFYVNAGTGEFLYQ